MKLLHTADWHIGKLLEGKSRLEEQQIVLDQFVHFAEETEADVICVAGDIFDNGHPSAAAEGLLYHTLKKLSNHGKRLVILIAGNHDQPSRLEAIAPLVKEHGILIYGTAKTKLPSGTYGTFEIQSLDEGVFSVNMHGEQAVFVCVPYPSEKSLNQVLYQEADEEKEKALDYSEKIKTLFEKKARWFKDDTINVLISHVFTLGSIKDGSEQGMMLGNSYLLPLDVFPKEAQYVALGHVHRPQKAPGSNGRIRYSGSPLPYRLQEAMVAKQCYLVELKPKEEAKIEEYFFVNPKPIEKWVCKNYEDALKRCKDDQDRPCYVYMQIYTDTYIREEQLKELKKYKEDILEVVPLFSTKEENVPSSTLLEKSFSELFSSYYMEKKGVEPDQEVLNLLLEIVEKEREYETDLDENQGTE